MTAATIAVREGAVPSAEAEEESAVLHPAAPAVAATKWQLAERENRSISFK
jgi:hypothetical protein